MLRIFKKLLGDPESQKARRTEKAGTDQRADTQDNFESNIERLSDPSLPSHEYFTELEKMTTAISSKNYIEAAGAARRSLPLLDNWLNTPVDEENRTNIRIPALSQGGTMMALIGDSDGLHELKELVAAHDFLAPYRAEADDHFEDLKLFNQLRAVIHENPGIIQNGIKIRLGIDDGHRVSRLIAYLEKGGEIQRVKTGKSYELYLSNAEISESTRDRIYSEPKNSGSHRVEKNAGKASIIDLKKLKIILLPPSPKAWEHRVELPTTSEAFADPNSAWKEIVVEAIPREDRPDPAFRKHYTTSDGVLSFDDLAKSEASIGAAGAVMLSNHDGCAENTAALHRDPYEIAVHPIGQGFAVRSKSGILSVYTADLALDFETDLEGAPEVVVNKERLLINQSEAHRALRCVALAPERNLYLFTHVDEAWCISREGKRLWGIRMPASEPEQFRYKIASFGTANEIEQALDVMGLQMPVTPDEIKSRYRKLARELHPDLHPGKEEQMKALNAASEKLTGLNAEELDGTATGNYETEVFMTIEFGAREDWIYAASFSGSGESVLVGSYSGKVVRIDKNGNPQKIYNVGSVPSRIIETDKFLYIMTSTRLYVIDSESLVSLKDCPSKCDVIVKDGLVLLVENKGVRVFSENGKPLGIALTKAPIRRVYTKDGDLIVETRTQRGIFKNLRKSTITTSL